MKLIVGGAYQGKLAFAFRLAEKGQGAEEGDALEDAKETDKKTDLRERKAAVADGRLDSLEAAFECGIVNHLHEYIRRFLTLGEAEAEAAADDFIETIMKRNRQAIVVCNELGCGIVPAERTDRLWRELTGAACQRLAEQSDEVFRVVCGLPQRLKGGIA